ncbi:MAG: S41 family peptidase, partial [Planctomycetota bacterium]
NGAMPDLDVPITPSHEAEGVDPQLQAAVDDLLDTSESFQADMHRPRGPDPLHPTIERLGLNHPLVSPEVRASAEKAPRPGRRLNTEEQRRVRPTAQPEPVSAPVASPASHPEELSVVPEPTDSAGPVIAPVAMPTGPSVEAGVEADVESGVDETTQENEPMNPIRTKGLAVAAAAMTGLATTSVAAETAPDDGRAPVHGGMIRHPDVSKDSIVFVYANDLWIVPREGGVAKPIASPPGRERFPRFSPDGRSLAFVGNYDGDRDIYRVGLENGAIPERLTHHPSNEELCDWTSTGELLYFQNGLAGLGRMDEIFTLSPEGGMPNKLPIAYGAWSSMHDDGEWIAYVQHDRDGRTWKRYRGGLASDIWLFNINSKQSKKITDFEGTDSQPMWHNDTVYYMSDDGPEHRRNIWKYDTKTGNRAQVTKHRDNDIKWPAIGPGANGRGEIVYQLGSHLHLLDLGSGRSRAVDVQIPGARTSIRPRVVDASEHLAGGDTSPSGKRVVFEARGDLWSVPAKNGTPINLTKTSGVGERNPAWSPCGQWIAYQSDETGEHELYVRQSDGKDEPRKLTNNHRWFIEDIVWAPDSESLVVLDQTGTLTLIEVESGDKTKIDTDPNAFGTDMSWSHDGAWLAYARGGDEGWNNSIWVYNVAEGRTTQVTSDMFNDSEPAFDREGEFLYFATNRAFNQPAYEDIGSSFVYNRTDQLAVVPLREDVESPFAPTIDEVSWQDEDADDEADEEAKDDEDADDEGDEDADEEEEADPITIDLAGFEARAELVPVGRGSFTNLYVVDGGKLVFGHSAGMPGGGDGSIKIIDINKAKEDGEDPEAKTVLEGTTNFGPTADGKRLIVAHQGKFAFIDPAPDQKMEDVISTDGMEVTIDPRAEWRQIFFDAWRRHRDYFYDPSMHGVDWDAIGKQYAAMLEDAVSRDDVSMIIGEMIGELNVGHAYYWGGDVEDEPSRSVGLLGADFELKNDAYRITNILQGAEWDLDARGPLSNKDVGVNDYLLAVNGEPVDTSKNVWASFVGMAGKTITITVNDAPEMNDDAREVVVEPIGNEGSLRYRDWVESNRAAVEAASSGRIGYIHVPDTGVNGQNELFRQFYGQMHKDALIIDERWNGGGQVPTRFIELLNRPRQNYFARRHGRDTPWPPDSHQGPKAMLANGPAGSGGDAFPWYFKKMNIGPVIGTRTWGGLVGIGGVPPLIDGGYTAVPNWAFYETDGTWGVEGHGVDPDIEVIDDPAKMWNGGDPQLDA